MKTKVSVLLDGESWDLVPASLSLPDGTALNVHTYMHRIYIYRIYIPHAVTHTAVLPVIRDDSAAFQRLRHIQYVLSLHTEPRGAGREIPRWCGSGGNGGVLHAPPCAPPSCCTCCVLPGALLAEGTRQAEGLRCKYTHERSSQLHYTNAAAAWHSSLHGTTAGEQPSLANRRRLRGACVVGHQMQVAPATRRDNRNQQP